MTVQKSVHKKKAQTLQVAFRLPPALIDRADRYVDQMNSAHPGLKATRTDAVRVLLTAALDSALPTSTPLSSNSRSLKVVEADNVLGRAEADADIVVHKGLTHKNRVGAQGRPIPLPDGCYRLVRIEPPQKHRTKKRRSLR